ncbi:ferredoxin [Rhodococcus koreensis]|uniref:ferredoxin n=1 Tax=Rhodococcus koreensis TaxID=99653 RepID=UPI003671CC60
MKISVDRGRCEGYGLCAEAASRLVELDDDGELVIKVEHLSAEQLADAQTAARVCPVAALRVG